MTSCVYKSCRAMQTEFLSNSKLQYNSIRKMSGTKRKWGCLRKIYSCLPWMRSQKIISKTEKSSKSSINAQFRNIEETSKKQVKGLKVVTAGD